nr:hypothetical protein [Tanacetum cinerariifolium]
DLVFKALDKSQMGEDCSMSSNKSVSKLVSLEPVIDKHYVELMVVGELLDANNVGNEKVLHKIVNVVKRNNVVEQVVITVVDSE